MDDHRPVSFAAPVRAAARPSTGAMRRRRLMSGLALLLSAAGSLVAGPAVALAPSACPGPVRQAQAAPTGVPWPLQRYDPKRLAGLADGRGITVAGIDSRGDARHPQPRGAVQAGTDQLDRGGPVLDR